MPSEARQKKIMEKLNRAQKCSILGPQNLGSGGGPGPPGPPPLDLHLGNGTSHYQSKVKTYEITNLDKNMIFTLKCSECLVFKLFLIPLMQNVNMNSLWNTR